MFLRKVTAMEIIYKVKCLVSGQTIFYGELGSMAKFIWWRLSAISSIFEQIRKKNSQIENDRISRSREKLSYKWPQRPAWGSSVTLTHFFVYNPLSTTICMNLRWKDSPNYLSQLSSFPSNVLMTPSRVVYCLWTLFSKKNCINFLTSQLQ